MRAVLFAFAVLGAGGCDRNVQPQCHAAVTHYYAAGCTINGGSETNAEDECTEQGDTLPGECDGVFDSLMSSLNDVPVSVSSPGQCNCDGQWESAIELCD